MKLDTIVKGGTITTAAESYVGDIGIASGKIVALGRDLQAANGAKVIDAKGKQVLPGAIDVHVHLQLPFCGTVSADDFESGTRAAARGGVTTVIDFAIQDVENGLMAGIEKRMAEADPKVAVDYSLHSIIIRWNEKTEKEMKKVVDYGIPSFKMFMIYEKEGWQSDDAALFSALSESANTGATICVHAESERVMNVLIKRYLQQKGVGAYGHVLSRPNFIEEEAIQRAIKWTEVSGGRLYIVHMSTGEGADQVKHGQERGVRVHAETCPQYLLLNDEVFKDKKFGHLWATCPQIKKAKDNERLWRGLVDGEVSVVSTDTCTFTKTQKAMWNGDFTKIPFGLPGVETLFPSVYTSGFKAGKFSLNHLVKLVCANPAKIMGLYPQKGTIALGSDADVIIIDPKKSKEIDYKELDTNCDWSPFQGWKMFGFPDTTLSRGKVVVEQGKFVGKKGQGKFVKRKPQMPLD
ncbi:MAG: dihydropyrimidinase [bacterium]